ncbi:concanavalin A-like lectin/glucanase domain-containing protein [Pilobolus umbonatus]|nr:concanavalin A-like lectin/glucanase domain-containing protein [Pilobolus umbonatus]
MNYVIKAKRENSIDRVFSTNNVALDGQGVTLEVKKNVFGKQTSAAFGTRRDDFLYGSYRAKMKLTDISGTVSAFYFYRNDTCEIDIESLSKLKDPDQVYFAIQPQVYHKNGSAAYVTSEKHPLPFVSSTGYHEYRFDWLPHSVNFYIDGVLVREMTTNIPKSPGRILFSHWTDGNPNFSGDLPTENAFMKIAQLNMFFNSSNSDRPPVCQKSTSPCSVWEIMNRSIIPESLAMNTGNANVLRLSWLFISLTSLSFLLSFVM